MDAGSAESSVNNNQGPSPRSGEAVTILWQDEHLLVINKPAGLLTLPDGYDPSAPYVRSLLEPQYGRLWIVHRLDRQTSGLLLLARSAAAHRSLNTQFEQHLVTKIYHALVWNAPAWDEKEVRLPLRANGDRRHRTVVDEQRGKPAHTSLRVLERLHGAALIEARPHTGRTHQIRAHLTAVGLFIVGDELYVRATHQPSSPTIVGRLMLHARSLKLAHPISGEQLYLEAPLPEDFIEFLSGFQWNKLPGSAV